MTLNRDDFGYEKRGRPLGPDAVARALRARGRDIVGGAGPQGRARAVAAKPGGSSETVLKIVSWTKSGADAAHQARYIGRVRERDREAGIPPVPLDTDRGARVEGPAAVAAELGSWRLAATGTTAPGPGARPAPTTGWR